MENDVNYLVICISGNKYFIRNNIPFSKRISSANQNFNFYLDSSSINRNFCPQTSQEIWLMDSQIKFSKLFFICLIFFSSCGTFDKKESLIKPDCHFPLGPTQQLKSLKNVVVYKTKKDFSGKVPILLNKTKDTVIGYPSPSDFSGNITGLNSKKLENGFLLDLVGVNVNTVFTFYNIKDYRSSETPSLKSFYENIVELDPFTEMYYCKTDFDEVKLNTIIRNNYLSDSCRRIK